MAVYFVLRFADKQGCVFECTAGARDDTFLAIGTNESCSYKADYKLYILRKMKDCIKYISVFIYLISFLLRLLASWATNRMLK